MKITKAQFITSAPELKACPRLNLPEFPLIGRSNAGKSSFINALANMKNLAKTSNTPGKTRLINLFNINDAFIFADLPGYGYAKVNAEMQNNWQKILEEYLLKRDTISCLIQFIDSRHPVQKNDLLMSEWIKFHKLPFFVIAAKTDQIAKQNIKNVCSSFEKVLQTEVLPFSKFSSTCNKDILDKIESFIPHS